MVGARPVDADVRVQRDGDDKQATAEVFLTAFKALPRLEQEHILGRMAHGRRLRRVREEVSDRLVIEKERGGEGLGRVATIWPSGSAGSGAGARRCTPGRSPQRVGPFSIRTATRTL